MAQVNTIRNIHNPTCSRNTKNFLHQLGDIQAIAIPIAPKTIIPEPTPIPIPLIKLTNV